MDNSLMIFMVYCLLLQSNLGFSSSISSSKNKSVTLVLPLKAKKIALPSLSSSASPNRLTFYRTKVSLTVSLNVGSPPQPVTMVLDTGSELPWLRCNRTKTSLPAAVFNPKLSTSYSPVICTTATCIKRTRDLILPVSCDPKNFCHVILSYADASSAEGNLATETFMVERSRIPGFAFGCMVDTPDDEDSRSTTGLIGMNQGALSFVSQMGFRQFSYCIASGDASGVLLFGAAAATLKYTPLVHMSSPVHPLPNFDRLAYTVGLEGIKVSDTILPLPKSILVPDHTGAGQTMFDSGTQFTFLLGEAYTALKKEFMKQATKLRLLNDPHFVFQGAMDLCYLVDESGSIPPLPAVTLMFPGSELRVAGFEKLLYKVPGERRGSDAIYCLTYGNSDLLGIEAYVIGHHHQQNLWIELDVAKSRLGLAEARCDLAAQSLAF